MREIRSAPSTKRPCERPVPDSGAMSTNVESSETAIAIRPYRPGDEGSLLTMWNTAVWADPIDEAIWRGRYLADPNFRRETCLIAAMGNRVMGFLLGFIGQERSSLADSVDRPCWIVSMGVVADVRRHGIGSELFGAFECAAREQGSSSILVGPYVPSYIAPGVDVDRYPESLEFFDAMGAPEIARPLSMKVSLTARQFPQFTDDVVVPWRNDLSVRPALPQDLLPCLEFVRREFPEWIEDVSQVIRSMHGPDHRSVTLHVAMRAERCIGFSLSRSERFGPFGVDPRERGRGVGRRLLEATLAGMRTQGFHAAWFLWTNDRAAGLYRRAGFEEVRRFSLRRKDLRT